ncbi:MAG: DHH family phosphoesterase [Deltaproteobacteria bacterium]|nr:DHH family phosphoesterase [Deltaproteobacteria bacterium]MBL7217428.1 DHH family phosphoesterase [Desulfobacteraceae bacterium]
MDHPFSKSTTSTEKCNRLLELISPEDTLGIVMNADPDAIASALALKRLFWRKVRKVVLYHVNTIERPDNLAFIKLLKIKLQRIRSMKGRKIKKWAIVDSQPHHHDRFRNHHFDIIIDHHKLGSLSKAPFLDIKEGYGANSTIMTEYLRASKITPSPRLATALFYGIKTDTNNFVRESLPNDINAFRYLYRFTNMNIIKKIESSEISKQTLSDFHLAMERLVLVKDIAFISMGEVVNPDILVIIADFFMKMAEANWSIVTGIYEEKLVVILRNAGFRGDAGKTAQKLFEPWGGLAGGHKSAARAEIPLKNIVNEIDDIPRLNRLVLKKLKSLKAGFEGD